MNTILSTHRTVPCVLCVLTAPVSIERICFNNYKSGRLSPTGRFRKEDF